VGGVALGSGCSSSDDDAAGSANKTSTGATGGTTGGTSAAGQGGTGTGGTGGSSTGGTSAMGGTGGSTGGSGASGGTSATGGTGGSTGGTTGGSAGAATGGAPAGGGGGSAGAAAGSPSTGGAPAGGMAGSLGSGGAAAGNGGGGMPATLVTPIMRSSTSYVLEFGDTYFEVNPSVGARVIDVHLKNGTNLLGHGMDADNMGSTFWPSPQSAWTWPPTGDSSIGNINSKPYTASADDTSMTFVGTASSVVGLSVTKKFTADLDKQAIVATYTMIGTAAGKSAAPWEITRFAQKGVTFYPSGSTPTGTSDSSMDLPATTTGADCTWLTAPGQFASASAKDQKLFADGTSGWLAHAEDGWVIVKKFQDTPASMAAPGEAEIEMYMNNPGNTQNPLPYMEVEVQGPYGAVGQAQMVNWTVTWFVRKLPDGVTATAGNAELVSFVQSLLQ
jgi:hypothetical protein